MITNGALITFYISIIGLVLIVSRNLRTNRSHLINKIYVAFSMILIEWMIALIGMRFTAPGDEIMLYVWDALSNFGTSLAPVLLLLIALVFTHHYDQLPKRVRGLFLVPLLTNVMIWTNPLHHLHYKHFSVIASEVVFGPYMYISGGYSYLCMIAAIVIILHFAFKSNNRLYMQQSVMFSLGTLIPLVVSMLATLKVLDLSIAATPISFVFTVIFHGIAIEKLNFLNITPIATQHILDWISDCYLILSETGLVLNYNQPFAQIIGSRCGIEINKPLINIHRDHDPSAMTAVYNLISSVESARESRSSIAYEQMIVADGRLHYYMVEVTPLIINKAIVGFSVIYKDVTKLKESMQNLQNSQKRMMERERLASLGQMVGGIAHNLKTPIMSIAGALNAMNDLVDECQRSFGDPEVTPADYREIAQEMTDWIHRCKDSCSYMSDIITAVKGQAANMNASDKITFTPEELLRRTTLLMRHELTVHNCQLVSENNVPPSVMLHGDINNLVQIVNNFIANAIDAQLPQSDHTIHLKIWQEDDQLSLSVSDHGSGISDSVRRHLLKEMITSKGTAGAGLGLYMSKALIQGKFDGELWFNDNPGGGAVFGFTIPLNSEVLQEETPLKSEERSPF